MKPTENAKHEITPAANRVLRKRCWSNNYVLVSITYPREITNEVSTRRFFVDITFLD